MWAIILLGSSLSAAAVLAKVELRATPAEVRPVDLQPQRSVPLLQPLRELRQAPAPRTQPPPSSGPGDYPAPHPALRAC